LALQIILALRPHDCIDHPLQPPPLPPLLPWPVHHAPSYRSVRTRRTRARAAPLTNGNGHHFRGSAHPHRPKPPLAASPRFSALPRRRQTTYNRNRNDEPIFAVDTKLSVIRYRRCGKQSVPKRRRIVRQVLEERNAGETALVMTERRSMVVQVREAKTLCSRRLWNISKNYWHNVNISLSDYNARGQCSLQGTPLLALQGHQGNCLSGSVNGRAAWIRKTMMMWVTLVATTTNLRITLHIIHYVLSISLYRSIVNFLWGPFELWLHRLNRVLLY